MGCSLHRGSRADSREFWFPGRQVAAGPAGDRAADPRDPFASYARFAAMLIVAI